MTWVLEGPAMAFIAKNGSYCRLNEAQQFASQAAAQAAQKHMGRLALTATAVNLTITASGPIDSPAYNPKVADQPAVGTFVYAQPVATTGLTATQADYLTVA